MKKYITYLTLLASVLVALSACNRVDEEDSDFDNVAYIEEAKSVKSEFIGLRNKDTQVEREIKASLALPTNSQVTINYKVDFSLVNYYNIISLTQCEALPETFYELSETEAVIPAGEVRSTAIDVIFKDLDNLPRSKTFILPVTIASASNINILEGSRTFYYLLRKGAPITTAANIDKTALYVPTMSDTGVASGLNNLGQVTLEALVRADEWGGANAGISTLMGIEGYFLIRFGDSSYEDQLQLATASTFGGNWPARDASKRLPKGEWLHIALTYDLAGTKEIIVYINGKVQSKENRGSAVSLNLTRATGSSPLNRFYIGKSWNDERPFHGEICETRIWNVVRTQEELVASKYEVDPATPGLLAYWKFDEGTGNVIQDYSGHGNNLTLAPKEDETSNNPLKWVSIELGEE